MRIPSQELAKRIPSMADQEAEKGQNVGIPMLVGISAAYLCLPYVFFFLGWFRWEIGLPVTATFLLAVFAAVRRWQGYPAGQPLATPPCPMEGCPPPPRGNFKSNLLTLVTGLGLLVVVTSLWGTGGYGPQDSDHPKHNAVLKTLIEENWPPFVQSDRGKFPLVFYVAYYLPASWVGKKFGWEAANHFLQAWSILGLTLSVIWFWTLTRKNSWVVPLVFFFFSGLDVFGAAILRFSANFHETGYFLPYVGDRIDWNALRWWNWQMRWWDMELARNYPNPIEQLFFVPHQAIAGWIATAILVTAGLASPALAATTWGVWCVLVLLWSPLVLVGFLPVVIWILWEQTATQAKGFFGTVRQSMSRPHLLILPAFVVVALYYAARFSPLPYPGSPVARFGIGNPWLPWNIFLPRLALFVILEFGIIAAILLVSRPWGSTAEARLAMLMFVWLAILPFFRFGACNDLVMRASVPGLFMLAAWSARTLSELRISRWKKLVLLGVLLIGATAPFSDLYAHFREALRKGRIVEIPAAETVQPLWQLNVRASQLAEESSHPLIRNFKGDEFFLQYIGSPDTLFFRVLAKPHTRSSTFENRQKENPIPKVYP